MSNIYRTYYRVADHLFAVESYNQALFSTMINYEPFLDHNHTKEQPIFTLQIAQEGLLSDDQRASYQHLFTDQSEKDMPRIEVYQNNGWLIRVSQVAESPICSEIECNANFTYGTLRIDYNCQDIRFCIDNALMLIYAFRTAPLMTLEMHAAVVVREEESTYSEHEQAKAYLFLGHSGTGKSTHARLWLQTFEDAWLLNDDNPIIRVLNNGEVYVYGSPWSGKTPCYKNARARIGGIVKLSQAPYNKIQALPLPQAYAYMLSSASGLKTDPQIADHLYNCIKHIITHVACYHMECLPNTEAAIVCEKEICKLS